MQTWGIQYLGTDPPWHFDRSDPTPRVVYQLLGAARYRVGSRRFVLRAGEVLVANGGLAGRGDFPFVEVRVPLPVFRQAEGILLPGRGPRRKAFAVPVAKRDVSVLESILVKMMREQDHDLPGRELAVRALLIELLVFLYRIERGALAPWDQHETLGSVLCHQRVQGVISYAGEHCQERWTIKRLAQMAGVNRTTFCRLHKVLAGTTPMKLITAARIARARQLMRDGTRELAEISEAVGFANPPAFFRAFRRVTGTTPRAFRRAAGNSPGAA